MSFARLRGGHYLRSPAPDKPPTMAAFHTRKSTMSAFTGSLTLTELDVDWRNWRLEQPLVYEVAAIGSGRVIAVPTAFVTDGASVPRALWALLPTWGSYSRAAVVHDYLCSLLDQNTPHKEAPSRKDADAVFLEAMKICGTGVVIRSVMYAAVRLYAIIAGK